MEEICLRNYAYLGDAIWELFVREITIKQTQNAKELHGITTERVNAKFQHDLLIKISDILTEDEQDIVRRARNLSVPVGANQIRVIIGWQRHLKR